jgi:hypothetical protein
VSGRYKWVRHEGGKLYSVGINADGTLYNPNNYPEDTVRTAVAAADARRRERRSNSAKKAAATRADRRDKKIYAVVQHLINGGSIKPGSHCEICGKGLDDPQSVARGIGSDCWQDVMQFLTEARTRRAAEAAA